MQIGPYTLRLMDTGRFRLDGGAMFGVVPRVLWEKENPPDEKNRIYMALNALLLQGKGRNILVDTGIGTKGDEKFTKIYAVDHSEHSLQKALQEAGLTPDDITDVIVTHLHFDHVGGATYYDEAGQLRLQFPRATYHVQKKQLEWAQAGFEKDRASYLRENIEPLVQSERLNLLDGPTRLFEGVEILLVHGHTPAMQLVRVSDASTRLLYCADLIPLAAHIPVPWVMAYDLYPVETIKEKKEILRRAVEEDWLLFFEHDPRVYCGTVELTEKGYRLKEPVTF